MDDRVRVPTQGALLQEMERFCRTHGMSESKFSLETAGDGKLFKRLRAGKTITLRTYARIMAFMARHEAASGSGPGQAA